METPKQSNNSQTVILLRKEKKRKPFKILFLLLEIHNIHGSIMLIIQVFLQVYYQRNKFFLCF